MKVPSLSYAKVTKIKVKVITRTTIEVHHGTDQEKTEQKVCVDAVFDRSLHASVINMNITDFGI